MACGQTNRREDKCHLLISGSENIAINVNRYIVIKSN